MWATVLPWEVEASSPQAVAASMFTQQLRTRRNLRRRPHAQQHASEPAQHTTWTAPPEDRDYLRGDAWGVVMPDGTPQDD